MGVQRIISALDKIDDLAVDGLSGTSDSIAYILQEIEKHFHNRERVFGNSSNAMLENEPVKFTVTGGDNTWGTELMLTDGTVIESGSATKKFDMNHLYVVSVSAANKITIIEILTSPINTPVACTFDFTGGAAEDIVLSTAHGLSNGDKIVLKEGGGALPAELNNYTAYYVVGADTDYFQVSLTSGGAAVQFTDDGGACFWYPIVSSVQSAAQTTKTAKPISAAATNRDSDPFETMMGRTFCNQRVFIRAKSETGSTVGIGFLVGLHVYDA